MIVYDKEQKQIVIPNGLGNVNIVINQGGGECPECPEEGVVIQDYKWVRPSMGEAAENGDIYIYPDEGYDAVRYIDLDPSTIYQEGVEQGRAEGGGGEGCILEDKVVFPTVDDVREGWLYVNPSEGYDGLYAAAVHTENLRQSWYDEGYNEGKAEGGGESGGCTLTTRTITQNGTYRANEGFDLGMIDFSQNGAFDSLLKVSENSMIEFYFAFKDEKPDLMSFFGCEDGDWQDSTFAARYYSGGIEVKIGSFTRNFNVDEYELANGMVHKMKVGKNYGISIDDRMLVTHQDIINEGITFEPSATRTIYIGAINSPDVDDNGLGIFWRPFNGYIGPVTIVGKNENDEEVKYNYEPGDFGWWGEYRIIQTGQRVENIYREPGATPLEWRRYYPNADGFSEVTVNLRTETRDIKCI